MSAPIPAVPPASRSPWQRLYAAVLARRARRLDERAARLPRPVVSVGNLGWGGAGKTPFVAALAEHWRAAGRRVAILSRGYGRSSRGALVVSRGGGPEVGVESAGDEPYLLARALPGVAVLVGERRSEAGQLALAELASPPDLFLLDDGFSHRALKRDIDLLLFAAADPWSGGRLLPAGRLREPITAARRADAVILTGADPARPGTGVELASQLASFGFSGPGFASFTRVGGARRADGAPLAEGTRVLAVAAIAHPESFFASARAAGLVLADRMALRDHAAYSERERREIERRARKVGAEVVLTTEKDRAKLEGRLASPLAVLPIQAEPDSAFWAWLDGRLAEVGR